jgi:uncharacterized membrane protein YhhN
VTALLAGLLAIAGLAAVADWAAIWRGGPRGRTIELVAKPLATLALLVAAIAWPVADPVAAAVRPWLVLGLAASLAGDALLLPPGRFTLGLAAFLVAHLAYLGGFLTVGVQPPWLALGFAGVAVLAGTVGVRLVRGARRVGLAVPVALYLVAICAMAAVATGTGEALAIGGAWLFVASDALLGWGRFRDPEPGLPRGGGRELGVAVMVTYHAAQLLILLALVA